MTLLKLIAVSLLLTIAACGGNKVITTTDDSTEYQSARQLPPLSKNPVSGSANDTARAIQLSESEIPATVTEDNQLISSSIVETNNNMRVRIDAEMNLAWPYFLNKLRTSGVTIHSRNNLANRVEVGCGAMDDGTGTSSTSSGWSVFNRSSVIYEYCVMELISNRNTTLVSVHDRYGDEVIGSEAIKLLNKIVSQ